MSPLVVKAGALATTATFIVGQAVAPAQVQFVALLAEEWEQ